MATINSDAKEKIENGSKDAQAHMISAGESIDVGDAMGHIEDAIDALNDALNELSEILDAEETDNDDD